MSLRRVNQEEVDAILGNAGVVRSMADVPPEERGVPLHEWRPVRQIPEYPVWINMRRRCENPTRSDFARYGGRGITVCERWRDSFENFLSDMGPRPHGYTLERVDNDGPYSPENCKWASRSEQARNRRGCLMLTCDGVTMNLIEWSEKTNIACDTIRRRMKLGWTIEKTLGTPTLDLAEEYRILSPENVEEIIRRRMSGERVGALATEYSVYRGTISKAIAGKYFQKRNQYKQAR